MYATLFPHRVRAMVLDGAVDATEPLARQAAQEAPAIEASLSHYFATCRADPHCPLGRTPRASTGTSVPARRAPLAAPGHGDTRPVTVGDLLTATLFFLSVPGVAGAFGPAVAAAAGGDGAPLRQLSVAFEEDLDGSSLLGPLWAFACGDAAAHPGPSAAGALAEALQHRYPLAGA